MTPTPPVIPVWPAIIKHDGDDELSYVASLSDWQADPALSAYPYQNTDILIDADGQVFELYYDNLQKSVNLNYTQMAISLSRFSELVQMHLARLGQCCISKATFKDYQQGFDIVASTSDTP
jgi:hypothetical protein